MTCNVPNSTNLQFWFEAAPFAAIAGGNQSTTKMFLSQTGDGTCSLAPQWSILTVADLTPLVFGASGTLHSIGAVPDPGATPGTTRFLREDATWQTVAGSVTSVFTRTGAIVATSGDYTVSQITGAAPLASPTLTGTPTAPTASIGTNTTQIASTAYVVANPAVSLATTGSPATPAVNVGSSPAPSIGQILTATSSTTATWQNAPSGFTNPMTTLGDMIYENVTPAAARVVGNTTTTKNFLTQTGTAGGTSSAIQGTNSNPNSGTPATLQTLTYTSNNVGGHLLFVVAKWIGAVTCSVTDTIGNTGWTPLPQQTNATSGDNTQAFYCLNCLPGANTVHFSFSGSGATLTSYFLTEFAGALSLVSHSESNVSGNPSLTTFQTCLFIQYIGASATTSMTNAGSWVSTVGFNVYPTQAGVFLQNTVAAGTITTSFGNPGINFCAGIAAFALLAPGSAAPVWGTILAADVPAIAESGITNLVSDLALKAPLASPTLTGTPAAPTASVGTNTTQLATTAFVLANSPRIITSGTATLGTSSIAATTAATVVTVAATGTLATDSIEWAFNAAPSTGYITGCYVLAYVTAGNVNFLVVNPTAGALVPAAATLNWRVLR